MNYKLNVDGNNKIKYMMAQKGGGTVGSDYCEIDTEEEWDDSLDVS